MASEVAPVGFNETKHLEQDTRKRGKGNEAAPDHGRGFRVNPGVPTGWPAIAKPAADSMVFGGRVLSSA